MSAPTVIRVARRSIHDSLLMFASEMSMISVESTRSVRTALATICFSEVSVRLSTSSTVCSLLFS